jgi:putative exporter of polyketide antibiotics
MPPLAHIAGLPVEESLQFAAPVAALWIAAIAARLAAIGSRISKRRR